jgi:hypothetical protein
MELKHDGNAEASSLTANRCRLIHLGGDRDFFVALNLFTYQLDRPNDQSTLSQLLTLHNSAIEQTLSMAN